jgi:hypothetical protein
VGLAAYLAVGLGFRRLAEALPDPHASFLATWGIGRPGVTQSLYKVIAAIVAGALSHSFVDSFTHAAGAGVALFPVLGQELFAVAGEPIHVFRILQYSGSVVGMAMILAVYCSALTLYCRASGKSFWQDSQRWRALFLLASVSVLAAVALNTEYFPKGFDLFAFRVFGFKFLITLLPVMAFGFLCFALLRDRRLR